MAREAISFDVLGQIVTYMTQEEVALVYQAMIRSEWDHRKQTRQELVDGRAKAYFTHPTAVAAFLAQRQCDSATIAAAFLHDVVEDVPEVTLADIEQEFGPTVAKLVDAVTKIKHQDGTTCERCTHDKLEAIASEDKRALLIKLADRYHNLQTLVHMQDLAKERSKVTEALTVYVPMAERYQLADLAKSLEGLAYRELARIERAGEWHGKG